MSASIMVSKVLSFWNTLSDDGVAMEKIVRIRIFRIAE